MARIIFFTLFPANIGRYAEPLIGIDLKGLDLIGVDLVGLDLIGSVLMTNQYKAYQI